MSIVRTTVRSPSDSGALFVNETAGRGFAGAAQMSVVMLARMRQISVNVLGETILGQSSAVTNGYLLAASAAQIFWTAGDGVGSPFALSRTLVTADIGKVHRFVGVLDVAAGFIHMYTNGMVGTSDAATGFTAAAAGTAVGVLGAGLGPDAGAVVSFDVMDLCAVGRAFTAAEVKQLDKLILATGRVPAAFAQWDMKLDADRLVNHSLAWDMGGLNAGRGMRARSIANASLAPTLSSVLIHPDDWGGF